MRGLLALLGVLALAFVVIFVFAGVAGAQDDDGDSGGGNRYCVLVATNTPNPYYVCS